MNRIDGHSHLLPAIDDGSQNESQSYRMLKLERANGVEVVWATPHFYPDGPTPTEFAKTRQEAYERLMTYVESQEDQIVPAIRQGAEVLLCTETADLEDLRSLAIEGTDYILIEMPYSDWDEWVYAGIERIRVRHGLTPIIAHVERYVPLQRDTEQIHRLLSMQGVLGQMNTASILNPRSSKLCHKMIQCHMVHVLGSDAHRGKHLLEVTKAFDEVREKHGKAMIEKLHQQGVCITCNKPIIKEDVLPFRRLWGRFYR